MNDNVYRKRVDKNQEQIVRALRSYGVSVLDIHIVGRGAPDLITGFKGRNILLEIKNPQTRWRLTPCEEKWHQRWQGQVSIVKTAEEALSLFGIKHDSLLDL